MVSSKTIVLMVSFLIGLITEWFFTSPWPRRFIGKIFGSDFEVRKFLRPNLFLILWRDGSSNMHGRRLFSFSSSSLEVSSKPLNSLYGSFEPSDGECAFYSFIFYSVLSSSEGLNIFMNCILLKLLLSNFLVALSNLPSVDFNATPYFTNIVFEGDVSMASMTCYFP